MNERCPFLDGINGLQCHQTRAVKAAYDQTGAKELGMTMVEFKTMLCETGSEESRLRDCPAGKALRSNPKDPTFSRPTVNMRPLS